MLSDIALEALRYFDRVALESLQMHSRYLRDLVNRHARVLPLRHIHSVVSAFASEAQFLICVRKLCPGKMCFRLRKVCIQWRF